jgi:hypothetical protein
MGILLVVLIVVIWLALQLYILPKLGIPTCLCGNCRAGKDEEDKDSNTNK